MLVGQFFYGFGAGVSYNKVMNEYKNFFLAAFWVFLALLSFYTMPTEIIFIVILISFILGIRGFIAHVRIVNKRLFKSSDDSSSTEKND